MNKKELLRIEAIESMSTFSKVFTLIGIITQIAVYIITGNVLLSMISGIFGVISVVLCSMRKMSFYLFGFAQLITYIVICLDQKLYGEIAENVFYFVTMMYGILHWVKHYDDETQKVDTRNLNGSQNAFIAILTIFASMVLYNYLSCTDDSQPFMDAITTVPAYVGQILMILRYKESWYYWLTIDVGSIIMWAIAGDWCMVAQFVFWTINCIYGLKKW